MDPYRSMYGPSEQIICGPLRTKKVHHEALVLFYIPAIRDCRLYLPALPDYPLRHPKYHLIETIRPSIEVLWGVYVAT